VGRRFVVARPIGEPAECSTRSADEQGAQPLRRRRAGLGLEVPLALLPVHRLRVHRIPDRVRLWLAPERAPIGAGSRHRGAACRMAGIWLVYRIARLAAADRPQPDIPVVPGAGIGWPRLRTCPVPWPLEAPGRAAAPSHPPSEAASKTGSGSGRVAGLDPSVDSGPARRLTEGQAPAVLGREAKTYMALGRGGAPKPPVCHHTEIPERPGVCRRPFGSVAEIRVP
jgi:hypothetical protein